MTPAIGWLLLVTVFPMVQFAQRHTVVMSQFQFQPHVLHAAVGDTVVWENRDIVPHTARADDGVWDTGNIPAKARHVMVVRSKGAQSYTCLYHANMKGRLVVE